MLFNDYICYLLFSAHSYDDRLLTPQLRTGVTEAGGTLSAAASTGKIFVMRDAGYICTHLGVSRCLIFKIPTEKEISLPGCSCLRVIGHEQFIWTHDIEATQTVVTLQHSVSVAQHRPVNG